MDWVIFLYLIILSECKGFFLVFQRMRHRHWKKTTGKLVQYIMIPSTHSLAAGGEPDYFTHIPCVCYAQEAFYHKEKDMFCEEILMCMAWYTAMGHSDIIWTSAMFCCYGPQLYFWVELMSMNVGLNFSQHSHRTWGTQCNSFTSKSGIPAYHAQYRFTHRYMWIIFTRPHVSVYTCIYLNINMKFKYLLLTGIPFVWKNPTTLNFILL